MKQNFDENKLEFILGDFNARLNNFDKLDVNGSATSTLEEVNK
jgi:hypothetical protein